MKFEPELRFWGQILGNTASPNRTTVSGSCQLLDESKGLDDTTARPLSSAPVRGSVRSSSLCSCGCSALYLEPITKTKDFSNFTLEVLFGFCFVLLRDNVLQGNPD